MSDKLKMHTPNKADENFAKLAALFPNAVTETKDEHGDIVRAIDKDILMLTPVFFETVNELVRYNITISVSSLKELKLIDKTAKNLNAKAKIQLKINTGMNRLGFNDNKSILKALNLVKNSKNLTLTGAFSHFGNVCNKAYTKSQFQKFLNLTKVIKKDYPKIDYHI